MPVYNGAQFLDESIESIITQTYTNWELIVIDDSSTDESCAIAKRYASRDNRILVFSNTHEKGLAGALNCGLSYARGAYIARADADDINVPQRLRIQYEYLQLHPTIDIVGSWYKTFGNNKTPQIRKHPTNSVSIAWRYLTDTYFCHPSVMFRRKVLETIPQYPLVTCEDFAFFSEIIHRHKGHNIAEVLLHYREHLSNYSVTKATLIKDSVFETYRKNFLYYSGNEKLIEAFYAFHAQYRLSLRTILPLLVQSFTIGNQILRSYKLERNLWQKIVLYSTIKIHFIKAIANSTVRTLVGK